MTAVDETQAITPRMSGKAAKPAPFDSENRVTPLGGPSKRARAQSQTLQSNMLSPQNYTTLPCTRTGAGLTVRPERPTEQGNYHLAGSGRPLQPTFPRTRLLKLGHVKHSTKDTTFNFTGQSTASFFIFANILPLTAPLMASKDSFELGTALGGVKISTRYLSSAPIWTSPLGGVASLIIHSSFGRGLHPTQ